MAVVNAAPQRRRQEILDAAVVVFHRTSYETATIQDVADEVGLLKGSLYHYISTKEDLLFEVCDQIVDEFVANIYRVLDRAESEPAIGLLRSVVEAHASFNLTNLEKAAVFHHDVRTLRPERYALVARKMDAYAEAMHALVRRAQAEGTVRTDVDPSLATTAIHSMLNLIHLWFRPDGPRAPQDISRELADMAVASIALSQ